MYKNRAIEIERQPSNIMGMFSVAVVSLVIEILSSERVGLPIDARD